jgi:hypothetical protein
MDHCPASESEECRELGNHCCGSPCIKDEDKNPWTKCVDLSQDATKLYPCAIGPTIYDYSYPEGSQGNGKGLFFDACSYSSTKESDLSSAVSGINIRSCADGGTCDPAKWYNTDGSTWSVSLGSVFGSLPGIDEGDIDLGAGGKLEWNLGSVNDNPDLDWVVTISGTQGTARRSYTKTETKKEHYYEPVFIPDPDTGRIIRRIVEREVTVTNSVTGEQSCTLNHIDITLPFGWTLYKDQFMEFSLQGPANIWARSWDWDGPNFGISPCIGGKCLIDLGNTGTKVRFDITCTDDSLTGFIGLEIPLGGE